MSLDRADVQEGDRVRIAPQKTDYDGPLWTIREPGTVRGVGTERA
jgi:hypothetical protein